MDKPLTLHPHELAAAIAGKLRQVRRPVVPQPILMVPEYASDARAWCMPIAVIGDWHEHGLLDGEKWPLALWAKHKCPLGQPGDVIWGKETWGVDCLTGDAESECIASQHRDCIVYRSDVIAKEARYSWAGFWKRPSSMPRWASRWHCPVTAVRVERAQDISTHDIGCCGINLENNNVGARNEYAINWNRHYAAKGYAFEANPWAWVVELGGVR